MEYYKVKMEIDDTIVHCNRNEVESRVFHNLYQNLETEIKISEVKEISEEEAYGG